MQAFNIAEGVLGQISHSCPCSGHSVRGAVLCSAQGFTPGHSDPHTGPRRLQSNQWASSVTSQDVRRGRHREGRTARPPARLQNLILGDLLAIAFESHMY